MREEAGINTHLNTQHLAEIMAELRPQRMQGAGAEKRRAPRMHVEAQVTVWKLVNGSPGPATTVLTRDLSHSGIGFLQATAETPAGQFIIQLPRAKGPLLILCHITFVRALAYQLYVVGAQFHRVLNPPTPAAKSTDSNVKGEGDALGDSLVELSKNLPTSVGTPANPPVNEPAVAVAATPEARETPVAKPPREPVSSTSKRQALTAN